MPVFQRNVSMQEDFGFPPGVNLSTCPQCYDTSDGSKFMGAGGQGGKRGCSRRMGARAGKWRGSAACVLH